MLMRGITQGHPFYDGNKPTGFFMVSYDLSVVGSPFPMRFDFDRTDALCVRPSAGDIRDVYVVADELERLWAGEPAPP